MKPPPFDYDAPETIDEALNLLAEHGDDAKVLAGGQSLVPLLSMRLARPARLVDVGRIPELSQHHLNGVTRIGATVRQCTVEHSTDIKTANPLLGKAIPLIGHAPIRNRGTIGGSVAHADPAAELPAVMLLLDAEIALRSKRDGERTVAAADFFEGFLTTVVRPDELLVELRLPPWPGNAGCGFQEIARRHGDFAIVGAGAVVALDEATGAVTHARLAYTGVAGTPIRVPGAEQVLLGHTPTVAVIDECVAVVQAALSPSDDVHASAAYRRHIAGVLTRRVLQEACDDAR
jgi:aerobic carbon-monoxide dehydrogenase medium subunit